MQKQSCLILSFNMIMSQYYIAIRTSAIEVNDKVK